MKQFKRVIAIVIATIMLMSFASCSMTGDPIDITNENVKIGVILKDVKDATTGNTGYAMAAINEVMNLGHGIGEERFNYVESVNPDDAAAVANALTTLVNKECNIIIATEAGYLDDIKKVSGGDNADIKFLVLNAENDGKNIYGYGADTKDVMFLAGMVAGLKSVELEVQQVGFIAASDKDTAAAEAFEEGAKAAGGAVTVEIIYSTDAAKAADQLIKNGCVVIASDYEDEAIAKAATDAKIFFCGFGSETYLNAVNEETGEKLYASSALIAPVFNFTQPFVDLVKYVIDNDMKEEKDKAKFEPAVGGFKTGEVFLSDCNDETVSKEIQAALKVACEEIIKDEADEEKEPVIEEEAATEEVAPEAE